MQYMIYHIGGKHLVVQEEDYLKMLDNKEWFKTPLEAEKAAEADKKAIKKELEADKAKELNELELQLAKKETELKAREADLKSKEETLFLAKMEFEEQQAGFLKSVEQDKVKKIKKESE